MTPTRIGPGDPAHLEEGDLVRILDGETPGNGSGPEAHLRGCAECREALDRIALRSTRVSRALAMADPSAPAPRAFEAPGTASGFRHGRWLRAAAITLLIVAAAALGSTTVRAWMASGWLAFRSTVAGLGSPLEPVETGAGAPGGSAARAAFTPRPGMFLLRLENRPAGGSLTIAATTVPIAEVAYGSEDRLLVLPDGISIQNEAGSTTDYRLTLPASVRTLTVVTGGDTIGTVGSEELRRGRVWRFEEGP